MTDKTWSRIGDALLAVFAFSIVVVAAWLIYNYQENKHHENEMKVCVSQGAQWEGNRCHVYSGG